MEKVNSSHREQPSEVTPEGAVEDRGCPDATPTDMAPSRPRSILDRTVSTTPPLLTPEVRFGYTIPMNENSDTTELPITRSETIEPLDLSPLTIARVKNGNQTLRIEPALELKPRLDEESKQLLVVEDEDIDLLAFAATREELEEEVLSHILLLWNEYANEDLDKLTPVAQKLRERLRRRIQSAAHAAT